MTDQPTVDELLAEAERFKRIDHGIAAGVIFDQIENPRLEREDIARTLVPQLAYALQRQVEATERAGAAVNLGEKAVLKAENERLRDENERLSRAFRERASAASRLDTENEQLREQVARLADEARDFDREQYNAHHRADKLQAENQRLREALLDLLDDGHLPAASERSPAEHRAVALTGYTGDDEAGERS